MFNFHVKTIRLIIIEIYLIDEIIDGIVLLWFLVCVIIDFHEPVLSPRSDS